MCAKGAERKIKRLREEEAQGRTAVYFQAYGISLDMGTAFKYLGRVFTASYDDCPKVVANLHKTRIR